MSPPAGCLALADSGLARQATLVAERVHEAIREVAAECGLEPDLRGCPLTRIARVECSDVGEEAGRGGRFDVLEGGGSHDRAIGPPVRGCDP